MNYSYLLCLCAFLFITCTEGGDSELSEARRAYESNQTPETAEAYAVAVNNYVQENAAADRKADALRDLAEAQLEQNQFAQAVETLQLALRDYPNAAGTAENALYLADVYEQRTGNAGGAAVVRQAFIERFPDHPVTAELQPQFANNPDLPRKVRVLAEQLYADTTGRIDYKLANEIVMTAETYALLLPEAEATPELLYQAGQIAGSARATNKVIELNQRLYQNHPEHPRAARALFLTAFAYDNDLNQPEVARPLYEEFLQKYPNDEFVESAEFQLKNLGKSADEIIREFEEQRGE